MYRINDAADRQLRWEVMVDCMIVVNNCADPNGKCTALSKVWQHRNLTIRSTLYPLIDEFTSPWQYMNSQCDVSGHAV